MAHQSTLAKRQTKYKMCKMIKLIKGGISPENRTISINNKNKLHLKMPLNSITT